jgi:hypothetical protein
MVNIRNFLKIISIRSRQCYSDSTLHIVPTTTTPTVTVPTTTLRNLYKLLSSLLPHLPHYLRNPPFVGMKLFSVQERKV